MIIRNILLLCFILSFESFIYISMVWNIIEYSNSYILLGSILTFITVALFLLKKKYSISRVSVESSFKINRILGAVFALSFLLVDEFDAITLYFILAIFSVIAFFNMNLIETLLLKEASKKNNNSVQLSLIFQTGSQLAGLLGAFMATLFLTYGNIYNSLEFAALILFLGVYLVKFFNFDNLKEIPFSIDTTKVKSGSLLLMFILTFWLFSLNFLLPIISQKINSWKAIEFGLVDIALGLGCLSITFIIIYSKKLNEVLRYASLAFIVISLIIFFTSNIYINILLFFILGLFFNAVRVFERSVIYASVDNNKAVTSYANRLTSYVFLGKSLPPLVLGVVLTYANSAIVLLVLSILLSLITFKYINLNYFKSSKNAG